ncbi:putative serine esterase [Hirsutella rhossiliensis]|uniref:Serine esterase n=1 Tax=Hirsutella rhossiliensis TaxID=111463 RepID=A0A9P8N2S3_9HYPO|nr:putative serine esterase [Hirsutella rhossiliensis]KAH0965800.1 putative serine esterase [Hirsutella rhossiliensis]
MLLLHQVGSVKIGEVVRYTVTYTPSQDRILPSPETLHVRIRNTSTIALRAAFVHGPYTLSVSAHPAGFSPNVKFDNPRRYGVPAFEPMLKAGGSWQCELVVPDDIRQAAGTGSHGAFGNGPDHDRESATWVIEVTSQVIFSTSAAVGYELVVARDPKSLNLTQPLPVVGNQSQVPQPGKVSDHQQSIGAKDGHHPAQPKGVFSRAIHVKVEDTATLWNTPRLPGWDDAGNERVENRRGADKPVESMVKTGDPETTDKKMSRKQEKVHLVILTHGLHSNLGADMLFLKESIDAAAKQAKIDAKARRAAKRQAEADRSTSPTGSDGQPKESPDNGSRSADEKQDKRDDEDDEEVIVRGYSGNATKTERGIKYLGKRLARYVLSITYPDQPFFPIGKGAGEGFGEGFKGENPPHLHQQTAHEFRQAHKHSTIQTDTNREHRKKQERQYKVTSISFVAHSLGGLVQMYAVAYIQKHSPQFFDLIKPINFIALATPFLGLSNENPLYVKFALDFGLVGRTGKDLGLTWRAPTIARSGWGAIVSNLGESAHKKMYGENQADSKPLLRILPTGPAHTALKKFRNRTVYSNVVNDGIVPLRTSCLLFLDWQGLGRVEKARRDAGLVETVVGFGWAELTGANMVNPRHRQWATDEQTIDSGTSTPRESMRQVPQPGNNAMSEDDKASIRSVPTPYKEEPGSPFTASEPNSAGPLAGFFNLFKSNEPPKEQPLSQKQKRILRRGQTMPLDQAPCSAPSSSASDDSSKPAKATSGNELGEALESVLAPPKTTFFESAGDLLNPGVPNVEYLIDPTKRPRTIFHDRVYHPSDIPPPPPKKRHSSLIRRKTSLKGSSELQQSANGSSSPGLPPNHEDSGSVAKKHAKSANSSPERGSGETADVSNIRVEEKIARGYHRDLAWRKVLVKLEPDAHNNICVRRMFANAYGWPVVNHLVEAHFSDSAVARMRTDDEHLGERALDMGHPPDEHGGETKEAPSQTKLSMPAAASPTAAASDTHTEIEAREALDEVPDLRKRHNGDAPGASPRSFGPPERADSVSWSERDWMDSDNESDTDFGGDANEHKQGQPGPQPSSASSWSWTEKIVGRGARGRGDSPKGGEGGKKVA